jgi:hypothetical protein
MKQSKNILILVVSLAFCINSSSQSLTISLNSGIGSFSMNDLKALNRQNLNALPFSAKITSNFPNFIYVKPALIYNSKGKISAGITLGYTSTGSRISSVDYSGEYALDNLTRAFSPGFIADYIIFDKRIAVSVYCEAGIEFTRLSVRKNITINNESEITLNTFKSSNYFFEPGIKVSYPLFFLNIGLSAGYLTDIHKGEFDYNGISNNLLKLTDGRNARSDWSGLRIGLCVSYRIFTRSKN